MHPRGLLQHESRRGDKAQHMEGRMSKFQTISHEARKTHISATPAASILLIHNHLASSTRPLSRIKPNKMSAPHPYPFYKQLYNDKGRSDVILRFGDQRVLAHRLILAGASELFHTAFKSKFPVSYCHLQNEVYMRADEA